MKKSVIVILFSILVMSVVSGCSRGVSKRNSIDSSVVESLEVRYGISISCANFGRATWDSLKCVELGEEDEARLAEYLELFGREFGKYPPGFVAKTSLNKIYLCKDLKIGDQYRAAVPDYFTEALYYDIYKGYKNDGYHADVIHHEYYHMIEQELNGDAYFKDPKWASFNPEGFSYGKGGSSMQNVCGSGLYNHPQEGFVSSYAASGLEEDKASLFACMMVAENREKIMQWAETDKVLEKKIDYMLDFLEGVCVEMGDAASGK